MTGPPLVRSSSQNESCDTLTVVETDESPGLVKAPDTKERLGVEGPLERRRYSEGARAAGLCPGVVGISNSVEAGGHEQLVSAEKSARVGHWDSPKPSRWHCRVLPRSRRCERRPRYRILIHA